MFFNGSTVELGAGSYPSAPDIPDEEEGRCEACGWSLDTELVDGQWLCEDCRRDKYLREASLETLLGFIRSSPDIETDFWHWCIEGLTKEEFVALAQRMIPYSLDMLVDFCRQNDDVFLKYMEGEY